MPWSRASVVCGSLVLAFGAVAVNAGLRPWVGYLVVGSVAASVVVALVVQAIRGHRGGCWLRRGLWFGMAAPGIPLRVVLPGL